MPITDELLLPLIETLAETDADWIAFEMNDALRAGRVAEETDDELKTVQHLVRSKEPGVRWSNELTSTPAPAQPITGAEQVDWAVSFINKRVSGALDLLDATFNQLETILFASSADASGKVMLDPRTKGITLVTHGDYEQQASVDREGAARSRTALPKLREALLKWAESARRPGHAE